MAWRYEFQRLTGPTGRRESAPRPLSMRPRMAVATNWRLADAATLRIFMHRFGQLEMQSLPGPARTRFRSKRLALVAFYRRHIGPLEPDRLWVGRDEYRRQYKPPRFKQPYPACRIHGHLLFAAEVV